MAEREVPELERGADAALTLILLEQESLERTQNIFHSWFSACIYVRLMESWRSVRRVDLPLHHIFLTLQINILKNIAFP